jgi:hypothetical protein
MLKLEIIKPLLLGNFEHSGVDCRTANPIPQGAKARFLGELCPAGEPRQGEQVAQSAEAKIPLEGAMVDFHSFFR